MKLKKLLIFIVILASAIFTLAFIIIPSGSIINIALDNIEPAIIFKGIESIIFTLL